MSRKRERKNEKLLEKIMEIHEKSRFTYGSLSVHTELRERGYLTGYNRTRWLMKLNKIWAKTKRRFKITTHSKHKYSVSSNLSKYIEIVKPNQAWASDITYIKTQEDWLYLCVIMDLYSRRIFGWRPKDRLTGEFVLKSFEIACYRRNPEEGLIFHSDGVSQYTSEEFRKALMQNGFIASMREKGKCYNNAYVESLFYTIKPEEVYGSIYETREVAKLRMFDYIEVFCNRVRRHSGLGYLSPCQFEKVLNLGKVA